MLSQVVLLQHAQRLDSQIIYDRDFDYDYFGFKVGHTVATRCTVFVQYNTAISICLDASFFSQCAAYHSCFDYSCLVAKKQTSVKQKHFLCASLHHSVCVQCLDC